MIKNNGFPLNVYKKLFESCVCTVSDYGGEIWGYKLYESNRQLQLRASRAYLGVPKQTPISGIFSEMNWPEPRSRTQLQMVRHFHRMLKTDDDRLIKKVFLWDRHLNEVGKVNTWSSEVKDILLRNNLPHVYSQGIFPLKHIIKSLKDSLLKKDQISWQSECRNLPEHSYSLKILLLIHRIFLSPLLSCKEKLCLNFALACYSCALSRVDMPGQDCRQREGCV